MFQAYPLAHLQVVLFTFETALAMAAQFLYASPTVEFQTKPVAGTQLDGSVLLTAMVFSIEAQSATQIPFCQVNDVLQMQVVELFGPTAWAMKEQLMKHWIVAGFQK